MSKYRGKYKKCRECKHSEEVMMWLVRVKESCPKHISFSSMNAVEKPTCEECEHFEPLCGKTAEGGNQKPSSNYMKDILKKYGRVEGGN